MTKKSAQKSSQAFEESIPKNVVYVLRLYVTGATPQSIRAIKNLKQICEEHLKGRYELEIIDIYQQPLLAEGDQIVAAPTLIKKLPHPLKKLIGDMSNTDRVLLGLDLKPKKTFMNKTTAKYQQLLTENENLRARLEEAEETLRAIRLGEIDALVIKGQEGNRVYTLKGAEHTYRVLIESMNEGAVTLSSDATIVYCNSCFAGMVKTPLERVTGKSIYSFFLARDHKYLDSLIQQKNKKMTRGDLHLTHGKSDALPVYVSLVPMQLENETGYSMIVSDLSEQKRNEELAAAEKLAEQRLLHEQESRRKFEESEQRFRAIWNSVSDAISLSDDQGIVIAANPAYFDLYGYKEKDIIGHDFSIIFPKEKRKAARQQYKELFKRDAISPSFDATIVRADGTERTVESRYDFITENGKRVAMVSIIRDISVRKKLELQKDEFIGVASHELKTPVTSTKAFAQILYRTFAKSGDESSARLLAKMDNQLNKLSNLINDLLDVTKIEGGKLQFHEERFNFDNLIRETVEEIQRTTSNHSILVEGVTKKQVYGDRERIGQVLINLLTNAIKYSPQSKLVLVKLSVNNGRVMVCVQDYGVGIPKEKQEKVFERFFRVSGVSGDTYPGLGLGLYISSEIIKRQNGQIWLESEPGKGSKFCFTLPLDHKK